MASTVEIHFQSLKDRTTRTAPAKFATEIMVVTGVCRGDRVIFTWPGNAMAATTCTLQGMLNTWPVLDDVG